MIDNTEMAEPIINVDGPEDQELRPNFIPYPTSTLSPKIDPPDLSNFKSRGITQVQRELSEQLSQLRKQYIDLLDNFHWNKLVYEAHFGFEPIVGTTYHLYRERDALVLSLIEPSKWKKKFVASMKLSADHQWEAVEVAEDFDLHHYIAHFTEA